jgi:hypothetical protein
MGGQTQVEVGDQDVDGIVVSLSPGMNLTGRVVMDAASPAVDGSPTIALYSEVLGSTLRSQVFAQFSNASQFTLRDVLPGDYRVQVLSAPGGTYVKSVRLGATDILSTPFRLEPSVSRETMEVVLGTDGGTLSGSVVTTTGGVREAIPGVTVALIPGGNLRNRTDLYRSATTNESGQFQLAGIAPGDYTAFALETAEEGLWREPEFIRRNERLGHAIRVTKASQERVEMSIGHTP